MNPHHIASLTRAELPTYPALNHLKAWDVPIFWRFRMTSRKERNSHHHHQLLAPIPRPFPAQRPWCLIHSNAPSNGSKGACAVAKPKPNATARSMRDISKERGRSRARDSKAWAQRRFKTGARFLIDVYLLVISHAYGKTQFQMGKFSNSMGHLHHS